MRNSRFVVALAAVACAAALPAVAAAHKGHPFHGHPGKGKSGNTTVVRLAPVAGQQAKGIVELKQRDGALSVAVRVSGLTPGAFYASHLHAGKCDAAQATTPAVVTFPDVYADERGVAKLVTSVPTAPGANFVAPNYYVDVHSGPSTSPPSAVIACGDLSIKPQKAAAVTWLKGATVHGRAEVFQKGTDVTVWISLSGLTPGTHSVHLHAGSCPAPGVAPGAITVSLGDVLAGSDGKASMKIASTSAIPVAGDGYSLDVHAVGGSVLNTDVVACGNLHSVSNHGHHH
jgi:Cu/Zn superoxide dismutase